jgi:repressor LexA
MQDLTPRQEQILAFIRERVARAGMPPTRAEIATEFKFSSQNSAEEHLRALARKGFLELKAGASRGIKLLKEELLENSGLPLVGRVAAGQPMLAAEHIEEYCAIDVRMFRPHADYLLRVSGMSMRDAGILDGDLIAVHRADGADNGQIVVARVDDEEVTVKRFFRHGEQVQLLPANPDFSPLLVNLREHSLALEGICVGVIRRMV